MPQPCFLFFFFFFFFIEDDQDNQHFVGVSYIQNCIEPVFLNILAYLSLFICLWLSALQFLIFLHYTYNTRGWEKKKKPTLAASISSNDLLAFYNHKQFRLLSLASSETEKENTWCNSSSSTLLPALQQRDQLLWSTAHLPLLRISGRRDMMSTNSHDENE